MKANKKYWLIRTRIQRLRIDGFKCSICDATINLDVHHIDGRGLGHKEPNHNVNNLVTLCHYCHMHLHSLESWRDEAAVRLRGKGYTLAQIGTALGVTRQRVHQILRLHATV